MSQPNLSPCPALSTSEFGSHSYHADRQRQTDRAGSLILDEAPRSAGTIGRGVRSAAKGSAVDSLALAGPRGQTEFQVNLKLGLTSRQGFPCPTLLLSLFRS